LIGDQTGIEDAGRRTQNTGEDQKLNNQLVYKSKFGIWNFSPITDYLIT